MQPDLDDTVRRAPRPLQPAEPDFDDTIVGWPGVVADSQRDTAPLPERVVAQPQAACYGFRIGANGRTVLLDTAAYVGRSPSSPRIQSGVMPKLVKVPSPQGEVSGTHLEIRQLATSIIVTDLRSTNGSTVSVPGSAPRSLRQGEAMVVTPGTLVDIGDGNVIEILPLQRQLGGLGHAH
ncbi:hypothetical protein GCM10027413_22840 [Conyzicola nivalis]|uniref:FHA domain-containing protein n=1 Tax=Conyzicola nivalis TaxID=1477021 RepID=A0A916SDP1_9MICO|nr:FHA domain-containing protein [Conyzicola nivalis]GGA92406.1 hypothetical protein GCM10010979_03780 [Conyzicola nivalis]